MSRKYLLSDSIISPIGFTTQENLEALRHSRSGLEFHDNSKFFPEGYYAGCIENDFINKAFGELGDPRLFTRLEKLMILAIQQILEKHPEIDLQKTGLVISTTKGNINELGKNDFPKDRVFIWKMAEVIAGFFGFTLKPVIISNACISGALAIKTTSDLIDAGRFSKAIVVAGDLVSDFVLSGFQSFQAISPLPCKPFSKDRQGVSLGEAAAAVLIGPDDPNNSAKVEYVDAVTANDANHISGPSRTGEGLFKSISNLVKRNKIEASEIDYLSAHGTATMYNDEMEAIAFNRAGLAQVPTNSFKAYYGHTLGASALIESILTKHSLLNNEVFASLNFTEAGVSKELNIIRKHENKDLKIAIKTASGFGGCNLAMLLKKQTI